MTKKRFRLMFCLKRKQNILLRALGEFQEKFPFLVVKTISAFIRANDLSVLVYGSEKVIKVTTKA